MAGFRPSSLLGAHPAFSLLPPPVLEEIALQLKEEIFPQGSKVIQEGERGDRLFIVTAGQAEVTISTASGPVPLALLSTGALFGEVALLRQEKKRAATVVALSDLSTLTLDGASFESVLSKHPEAEEYFSQAAEQLLMTDFLKLASPFGALKTERLRLLAQKINRLSLKRGSYIVREGERGSSCFLVRTGQVEVLQGERGLEKTIATLGPGSLFGEAALLTESPRNASGKDSEKTELLEIKRDDFIKIIEEDRKLSHQIFELLNLRDKPKRVSGIKEHATTTEEGVAVTILIHPVQGTYFRLTPHGCLIWKNLDGSKNLRDLTLLYFEKFHLFSPHTIAETLSGLVASGFAESQTSRASWMFLPSWGQRTGRLLQSFFEWRIMLRNTDDIIARLYRVLSPLFSRNGQALLGTVSLLGLGVFLHDFMSHHRLGIDHVSWSSLSALFAFFLVSGLLHEAGHALSTKSFGRKVLGIGIGWNWIGPILFVDTSDMWLAPRWQRMVVHWAGPYAHLVLGGIASIMAHCFDNPPIKDALQLFALLSYLLFLLNIVPILNFDGHYLLKELRSKQP